ncbi:hypothetical protein BT96DRAFT_37611 [Gymnopus androsaceus JB14]|uniref:Uncharacterized protein n=1 Tax=Gymnopus androsaceus JB14 TaxID=1447944 RepID=A0A6A4GDN5_9AGAR|nr:hypothetical protein BT96DRAFT_37611 [Gymnopus androsaceus JB14]
MKQILFFSPLDFLPSLAFSRVLSLQWMHMYMFFLAILLLDDYNGEYDYPSFPLLPILPSRFFFVSSTIITNSCVSPFFFSSLRLHCLPLTY